MSDIIREIPFKEKHPYVTIDVKRIDYEDIPPKSSYSFLRENFSVVVINSSIRFVVHKDLFFAIDFGLYKFWYSYDHLGRYVRLEMFEKPV
jgi:hypothetical protein